MVMTRPSRFACRRSARGNGVRGKGVELNLTPLRIPTATPPTLTHTHTHKHVLTHTKLATPAAGALPAAERKPRISVFRKSHTTRNAL